MLAVLFRGSSSWSGGGAESVLPRTESLLWGYVENKPLPPLRTIWTNSSERQLCGGRENCECLCWGGKGERKRKEEEILKKQENV